MPASLGRAITLCHSMPKLKKLLNIILTIFFIFRPGQKAASEERENLSETERAKYLSANLSLESKSGRIRPPKENRVTTSEVAAVKGADIYSLTSKAIELIGGMSSIVKPKDRVFIKPNYITGGLDGHDPVAAGEIPHPQVVACVAEECLKAGAAEVVIGEWVERPIKINFAGREGKEGAQVKRLIERLNRKYGNKVYLINLMEHTSYFRFFPTSTSLKVLAIPDIVAQADVVISIPAIKTHHKPSPVSLGMKNFMGIMPSVLYGEPRYKLHEAGVHQVIVDINKALRPALVVASGAFGLENRGASLFLGGKPVDVSQRIGGYLVVAGKDPVATDAMVTRIISRDWSPVPEEKGLGSAWYVHHIRMAQEQGLGIADSSKIILLGEKLEDISMNWQPSDDGVYPELPGKEYEKEMH